MLFDCVLDVAGVIDYQLLSPLHLEDSDKIYKQEVTLYIYICSYCSHSLMQYACNITFPDAVCLKCLLPAL